jgi:hypothetical protein
MTMMMGKSMQKWILKGFICFSLAAGVYGRDNDCPVAEMPLSLTGDCDADIAPAYVASGWMGDVSAIDMDFCWGNYAYEGDTCVRVSFNKKGGWGGAVWSDPPNDWGQLPGGWDLSKATNLSFYARGEKGGERVNFQMGLLRRKPYSDSAHGSTGTTILTDNWKRYNIPLKKKDLSCVKTGFAWIVRDPKEPVVFFLDRIQYE